MVDVNLSFQKFYDYVSTRTTDSRNRPLLLLIVLFLQQQHFMLANSIFQKFILTKQINLSLSSDIKAMSFCKQELHAVVCQILHLKREEPPFSLRTQCHQMIQTPYSHLLTLL